ncbi:unnamed protein product [Cyprideis torosa]|uniref:Uncharacterized protein n=1 Tax=Cyprideis torosa TaxID=163714 RepID=A0A7R8W9G4_9CRUS|nr:unnamed protein product [Cyprideis torosa]CAG0889788.1 unnamed protein product [Cyprideis torosa]
MIGDCFNNATFHEMKRVYSTYCLKQEEALDLLANYHRDVEIVAYFRSVLDELKSHDVVLFDLAALLHWPVKRVLSYHLLLTEIKKSTPEGHRDLFGVSVACGEMHEVSAALNEVKRRKDMIAKYCKERRERSFRDRMSKVSIHSIEKKKSRLSQKMMTTVGWTDTTTDPLFESAQKNLHSLRDTLLYLIDHLPRSHDQLRHILKAQFAEAEHWIALYAEREDDGQSPAPQADVLAPGFRPRVSTAEANSHPSGKLSLQLLWAMMRKLLQTHPSAPVPITASVGPSRSAFDSAIQHSQDKRQDQK